MGELSLFQGEKCMDINPKTKSDLVENILEKRGNERSKEDPPNRISLCFSTVKSIFCSRFVAVFFYGFCLMVFLPLNYKDMQLNYHRKDTHFLSWIIGTYTVLLTLPISIYHIYSHLASFYVPAQQAHIVRIIAMVPIYSIQSWFALSFRTPAMQSVREAYEAYVIYCFMQFLIGYVGEKKLVRSLARKPKSMGFHTAPFCYLNPWRMGEKFLLNCKHGTLQYVIIRAFTAVCTLLLSCFGKYDQASYSPAGPSLWIMLVNCFSQTWALYVLVLFYHATKAELNSINPFGKFLAVKSVVFFSWWQSLCIQVVVWSGFFRATTKTVEEIANEVQELLICVEMLFAAVVFTCVFPSADFAAASHSFLGRNNARKMRKSCPMAFWISSFPLDLHKDIMDAWVFLRSSNGHFLKHDHRLSMLQSRKRGNKNINLGAESETLLDIPYTAKIVHV